MDFGKAFETRYEIASFNVLRKVIPALVLALALAPMAHAEDLAKASRFLSWAAKIRGLNENKLNPSARHQLRLQGLALYLAACDEMIGAADPHLFMIDACLQVHAVVDALPPKDRATVNRNKTAIEAGNYATFRDS